MKGLYLGIFGSLLAAGGSIVYAMMVSSKSKKVAERLDLAVDNLSDSIDIDISQEVVKEATEKAINKAVDSEVKKAVVWVHDDVNKRIRTDVKEAVDRAYPEVSEGVRERLERSLTDVDISKLKDEVAEKAAQKASEKFDSTLESIFNDFNRKIQKLSNIYLGSSNNSYTSFKDLTDNDVWNLIRLKNHNII